MRQFINTDLLVPLWYTICACVLNILKIMTFVIGMMQLVFFKFILDAFPPRPKMPFGQ